jgi:hypothetical protein
MSERRLMSVRSELVRETMVDTICERALARADESVPAPVASALRGAAHPELARAGYFARTVETELFEPARQPTPGLAKELREHLAGGSTWPSGVSRLASTASNREPLERPDPDDHDAFSWRVPGPGGHVRHYVALRLIGSGEPALKRDVIYGFAVRCCEEVAPA